ncbi:hypothetical protein GALMADRAFT_271541 [Galerina marginata CBS 339.88]|uniref:Uncharacterized protein n=1 Tax=Galerina marginata (strain CBS 339.88) TaxID=685588 RepID=A0A067SS31_GALM3|nr:hypothetical protein GALMADRAFT_271541 [Galerina marginata CBS 339.88]
MKKAVKQPSSCVSDSSSPSSTMEMLRAEATIKRAMQALKKSLSKSSPPNEKKKTPDYNSGVRNSFFSLFNEQKDTIHAFGILGVAAAPTAPNSESRWMTADFAAWVFLISLMRGYSTHRSKWMTVRPIDHLFPDRSVVFGDPGYEQLVLPLPRLESNCDPEISAPDFAGLFLLSLQRMALNIKRGEKLLLLLIGHGYCEESALNRENPKFQLLLATQADSDEVIGEAFITKFQLETAVEPYRGDIVVICNSRFSSLLKSDRWMLLCSVDPEQAANALAGSHFTHERGSAFTTCAVAQTACERGQQFKPHPSQIALSSNISFNDFVSSMLQTERFLTERVSGTFPTNSPKSKATHTDIHQFTRRIGVPTNSPDYLTFYKQMCNIAYLQGLDTERPLPSVQPMPMLRYNNLAPRFDPRLIKLATAMPDSAYFPWCPKATYALNCSDLRRHISEPERYAFPARTNFSVGEKTMLIMLHSYHVLDVAVQIIARELDWCDPVSASPGKVEVFLPQKLENRDFYKMIESGVKINELPWYLKQYHFPSMYPKLDDNCAQWLCGRWETAGKPPVLRSEWDELVRKVGILTEREAIC